MTLSLFFFIGFSPVLFSMAFSLSFARSLASVGKASVEPLAEVPVRPPSVELDLGGPPSECGSWLCEGGCDEDEEDGSTDRDERRVNLVYLFASVSGSWSIRAVLGRSARDGLKKDD